MEQLTGETIVRLSERREGTAEDYIRRETWYLKAGRMVIVHVGDVAPVPYEYPFTSIYSSEWFRPELEFRWRSTRPEIWSQWEQVERTLRAVKK